MTGLEIALFILGAAFIIISFFIVGNTDRTAKEAAASAFDTNTLEQMHEAFVEKSNKKADLILHDVEDKLESLSNDKIIAVGEYSDQMLQKIESNHKEVVFLYQMLNEKEEELKKTALGMENTRVECEKLLRTAEEAKQRVEEMAEKAKAPVKAPAESALARPASGVRRPSAGSTANAGNNESKPAPVRRKKSVEVPEPAAEVRKAPSRSTQVKDAEPLGAEAQGAAENLDTGIINRNDEIIALHKSGKSVMEISKLLGMGQGEVKLIIDLYC